MDVAVAPPANLQPPRRLRHLQRHQGPQRRGYNQGTLVALLDEQERLIRMRGIATEVVQEFDPLHNLPEPQEDEQGRRTLEFRFDDNLEKSIADQINRKIEENVRSRFKLKITSWITLRNVEDNSTMDWYNKDIEPSPWFETLAAAYAWVIQQEEVRLDPAHLRRPNTKWSYELTKNVYVKVILDRHPLFLGLGRLPDWLRNKRGVLALDTYQDNRCLFRCIAVHCGAHVRDNMRKTRALEESFFTQRPGLRNRLTDKHLSLLESHFKQGIAAYTVQPNGDFVLTHLPANYDQVGRPLLNMGLYDGHAFLIKDLKQVTNNYTCGGCQARFTQSCHLVRHVASSCSRGQTKINCPNTRIWFPYPHAIVYDFESYQGMSKAERPTRDLFYESEHVPISVSIADTLHSEPEYIVSRDPAELIHLFYQSLERRHAAIVADVVDKFGLSDIDGIPEKQGETIVQWFTQVPVLGFNSGHYDLKLIRQYFIPLMAQDTGVFAAEKNGRIMFITTPKFKFLDVVNYLAPGITYDKWVKTYGATLTKSWLPYKWLDSPDKLDFPGLPPYMAWYSKLKGEYSLMLKEYDDCHRIFREKGMRTFGDWLEYYNNLDVAPFLEALQKMKEFYTNLGIDIFKDAVSLPGVSEKYILRKTLQPRRGYNPPKLFAPNKKAYAMLKAAVVGGPSLVFTCKHVAGETRIRSHQYEDARLCRRILGYDANSLYPSTMMKEMTCGPGFVQTYKNPEACAQVFLQFLWSGE